MNDEVLTDGKTVVEGLRQRIRELECRLADVQGARTILEKLFDSTRAIAYVFDESGHFLRWSPYFYEEVLGWSPQEMATQTVLDTIAPEDRERIRASMRSAVPGSQVAIECHALAKDGRRVAMLAYSNRFSHENRLIFAGQAVPIEDRLRAEEQLRESDERFAKIFQASPAIMAISDIETDRFIEVNRRTIETLGFAREEMLNHTSVELGIWLHPEQRRRALENVRLTGRHKREVIQFVTKRGEVRELEWSAEVLTLTGKEVLVTLLNDITDRVTAERALKERDEYFYRLLNDSRDVIIVSSCDGTVKTVLGAANEALGCSWGDWVGRAMEAGIHPEDMAAFTQFVGERLREPGTTSRTEARIRHADGHWVPIEFIVTNLTADPIIAGMVYNLRDITVRVAADAERARLQDRLQQAAKMEAIGRLAGGVAHDFNNMLTVIAGNVELARLLPLDSAPLAEHLSEISGAAQSAATLTRQLLAFSRQQPRDVKVVELGRLLRNLERMLRRVLGEDVQLVVTLNDQNSQIAIDPSQFEQIVLNLAVNARDAMPDGGTLLIDSRIAELDDAFCHAHRSTQPGRFVVMSVTDTGAGIAPELQGRVFEPFFTTKELGRGTGLGLATVYGIIEQAAGAIDLYSEVGIGTTFRVYLPCVCGFTSSTSEDEKTLMTPSGNGEMVLLVEDDEAVRAVAVAFLEQLGYRVHALGSASDALRAVAQGTLEGVSVLLTDVVMPGMNGRELVDAMRKSCPRLAVLYMSGYAESVIKQRQIIASGAQFISKPYSMMELGRKLREVIDAQART